MVLFYFWVGVVLGAGAMAFVFAYVLARADAEEMDEIDCLSLTEEELKAALDKGNGPADKEAKG